MKVKSIEYFNLLREGISQASFFKDTRGLRKRRGEMQDLGGKKRSVTKMNSRSLGWEWNKRAPQLRLIIHASSKTEDATRNQPPEVCWIPEAVSIRKRRSLRKVLHQVFMRGKCWWLIDGPSWEGTRIWGLREGKRFRFLDVKGLLVSINWLV